MHRPRIILLFLNSFGELEQPGRPWQGLVNSKLREEELKGFLERSFHHWLHYLIRSVVNEFPLRNPLTPNNKKHTVNLSRIDVGLSFDHWLTILLPTQNSDSLARVSLAKAGRGDSTVYPVFRQLPW